jgi:hypothetical protein
MTSLSGFPAAAVGRLAGAGEAVTTLLAGSRRQL